jgi:hypothetical protein
MLAREVWGPGRSLSGVPQLKARQLPERRRLKREQDLSRSPKGEWIYFLKR